MFNLFSIFKKNKGRHIEQKLCCLGCKYLFYWNDGSAGCDLDKQYTCTHNNFILRQEDDDRETGYVI